MIEFFIAKKQMFERKKQSILSIVGVFIGITVLIVSLGVSNGLDKNMINSILSLTSHITVYSPENISDYEEISKEIETIKGVKGVVPTIETQGIVKYEGGIEPYVAGVKVVGYDLEKAVKTMNLDKYIIDGKIDLEDKKGVLIGNELAKATGASVGDKIKLITSEETDLEMNVAGIFQSGFYEYDINMVLIPLTTAQYITYSDNTVGKLSVRLDNPYDAQEIIFDVARKLPETYFIGTWGEQNKALLSALTLEKTIEVLTGKEITSQEIIEITEVFKIETIEIAVIAEKMERETSKAEIIEIRTDLSETEEIITLKKKIEVSTGMEIIS